MYVLATELCCFQDFSFNSTAVRNTLDMACHQVPYDKLYNRHWQRKYDATIIIIIVLLTNCSADKKNAKKPGQKFVDGP